MEQPQPAHHQGMIGRKRLQQEFLVGERVQKNIVVRVELANELRDRRARLRNLRFHAARSVDQDPDRYRRVGVAAQELERPLDAVDVDAEVAPLQAGDVVARLIRYRHGHLLVAALAAQRARRKLKFMTLLRRERRRRGRTLAPLACRRHRHFEHRVALAVDHRTRRNRFALLRGRRRCQGKRYPETDRCPRHTTVSLAVLKHGVFARSRSCPSRRLAALHSHPRATEYHFFIASAGIKTASEGNLFQLYLWPKRWI